MKQTILAIAMGASLFAGNVMAADYVVDTKGAHASVQFKIQHLGYSWLTGRFNRFDGQFSYDAKNPEAAKISVNIDPASVDSNHAERDKHLRSSDFLEVSKFKTSTFESTSVKDLGNGKLEVKGNFTLRGVTKPIVLDVEKIGEGKDPWGGYRVGFAGTTQVALADYGVPTNLGPASANVELELHIEGIKQ